MNQSESTDKIAAALSKAQGAYEPLIQNKTVKYQQVNFSYADLAGTFENVRKPLSENGLAIVQTTQMDTGAFWLEAQLVHSSGQFYKSTYPLPLNAKPQDMGSALTYARRYTLCALLGIAAEEDDDGQRAAETKATVPKGTVKGQGRAASPPGDPPPKTEPQARGGAPYFIPVPVPKQNLHLGAGAHETMETAWKSWIAEYTSALDDAEDVDTINAIEKANKAPLDGLQAASEKGYGHVVGYAHERRKRAADNPLGAG